MKEDVSKLHDHGGERMILCGILNCGRELLAHLDEMGFSKGDLFFDAHQSAFDLFSFVAYGSEAPILLAVWDEMRRRSKRDGWLSGSLSNNRDAAMLLADCQVHFLSWHLDTWRIMKDRPPEECVPQEVVLWLTEPVDYTYEGLLTAAVAYAQRVRWLASRRAAYHKAREVIRDAVDPTGDTDFYKENW